MLQLGGTGSARATVPLPRSPPDAGDGRPVLQRSSTGSSKPCEGCWSARGPPRDHCQASRRRIRFLRPGRRSVPGSCWLRIEPAHAPAPQLGSTGLVFFGTAAECTGAPVVGPLPGARRAGRGAAANRAVVLPRCRSCGWRSCPLRSWARVPELFWRSGLGETFDLPGRSVELEPSANAIRLPSQQQGGGDALSSSGFQATARARAARSSHHWRRICCVAAR